MLTIVFFDAKRARKIEYDKRWAICKICKVEQFKYARSPFQCGKYQGYYLQAHKFSLFKRIYFIISLKILYIMYPTKVISLARSSSSGFFSSSCIVCTKFKHWLHIISIDILLKIYKISFPVNWISKSNWMNGTHTKK